MTFGRTTPIFRIFDEGKAREFYVGFLGFTIDWEHRFEPGAPLYLQVSKDVCVLHLSEHYGDGTPGSAVRIQTSDIDAFHRELMAGVTSTLVPVFRTSPGALARYPYRIRSGIG